MRMSAFGSVGLWLACATSFANAWPGGDLAQAGAGGADCTPLQEAAIPVQHGVRFSIDIQPVLQANCDACHGQSPTQGFDVRIDGARLSLIGADETGAPFRNIASIFRVRPGKPSESGFFLKINCAIPPVPYGSRMPPGPTPLPASFQALVHDWIAAGALMPDAGGDRTFIGNFESISRPTPAP